MTATSLLFVLLSALAHSTWNLLLKQEGLGVSREWVSRSYRKEALGLAVAQFVRLVSREDPTTA